MTGITHKQARDYINAFADGLIQEQERELLNEHLKTCDECRAYAGQMNALESRLRHSFHHRWEPLHGPSENLAQTVQSSARKIAMTDRINLRLKIIAGFAALIVLGIIFGSVIWQLKSHSIKNPSTNPTTTIISTATAVSSSGRSIAFVSDQDGNSEIYVMRADGSGVTDITNNPAYDGNPVWSPDGTKIAFESDRNGHRNIFVMNPDGSELTQLTHDSANHILGAAPESRIFSLKRSDIWSPDSRQLLFSSDRTGQWLLNVMNADGSGVTQLMQANDPPVADVLWSPSGKQVAYTSNTANGWVQIMAVNIDGTHRRLIATGDPIKSNAVWDTGGDIAWSPDEQFIYYEHETNDGYWYIVKAAADGANTSQVVASGYALAQGSYSDAWLGNDSALYYVLTSHGDGGGAFTWWPTNPGKTIQWDLLALCDVSQYTPGYMYYGDWAASNAGSQLVLAVPCPTKGYSELYFLDSMTGAFNEIAQIPAAWSDVAISWSADDQVVLIRGKDQSGKTEIYLLNADDLQTKSPGMLRLIWSGESTQVVLQPVPINRVATENQLPVVPTLHPNETSTPLWTGTSNGDLIAFDSNRDGNEDIYLARSDGTGVTNLTNNPEDSGGPVWSPDGNHIAFTRYKNDSVPVIYVMRPDGTNAHPVSVDGISLYAWSPDSQKIAYLVSQPQDPTVLYSPAKMSLKIVDLYGNVQQSIDLGTFSQVDQLRWSPDGHSLYYVATQMAIDATGATKLTESDIDQISLDGKLPDVLVKSDQQIDAWIGTVQALTYLVRDTSAWNLIRTNRQGQTRLATWAVGPSQCGIPGQFDWDSIASSSNMRWSPNGKQLLIEVNCDTSPEFYLGSTDGQFVKLMNYPVLGADSFSWSPDGQSMIFSSARDSSGNSALYTLNVKATLKDPATLPIRITTSGFDETSPDWQPRP